MTKTQTRGWHRIVTGWYVFVNAAGKELAYAEKTGSHWTITVLPMGDQARKITLSAKPKTLKAAKVLAEDIYKYQTAQALKAEAEKAARLAALGI